RERVREAVRSRGLADRVVRLEHVGSTAVPDLAAKDVVDLDVVVADGAVESVADALVAELGGTRYENDPTWNPVARRHAGQRFNDHVFAASSDGWKVSVATRDVLRARPDLREEYEALKRDLVADTDDLTEYSRGKTAFVERLLTVARESDDLTSEFRVPTR
ncbi:GrpB family protein, partial [Halobium palmae]